MYLPSHFATTDRDALHALILAHPLATWATAVDGKPLVNHVPFHLDPSHGEHGMLIGHVARANPVWQQAGPSVFVFQGEQAYVSPGWYASKREHGQVVPTWNYAVVHAHGTPRFSDDKALLRGIVERLTGVHEAGRAHPWAVGDAPEAYIERMLEVIVAVQVPIERLVGKFKLSQNRSAADREGVRQGLAGEPAAEARALASMVPPGA